MTSAEIRAKLKCRSGRFTMLRSELTDRLGQPDDIHLLRNWCRDTGRDVARLTYKTDDGEVELFCPIGFLNGEMAVLDGWLIVSGRPEPNPGPRVARGLPPTQPGLFDSPSPPQPPAPPADCTPFQAAGQRTLDELYPDASRDRGGQAEG